MVSADSALGSVQVTEEIPIIRDIVFPLSAAPESPEPLDFVVQYGQGLSMGDEVYIHLYSAAATPDLSCNGMPTTLSDFDHYAIMWTNAAGSWDPSGWANSGKFSNFRAPASLPVTDGSDIPLGLDVTFDELADATNPWTIMIRLKYTKPDFESGYVTETDQFDLAAYLQVNIEQSTFDFGSIEQGQIEIAISSPISGYLNITVTSNGAYRVQVSGTNPDDGEGNSFDVSNIVQNSVNDPASGLSLSGTAGDVANLGDLPIGTATHHLYLWISIPLDAPVGTYTFTLTVTIVAI